MTDYFQKGPVVAIEDLTEDQAVAVFGRPVYNAWKTVFQAVCKVNRGTCRVASVDRTKGQITLEWAEEQEERPVTITRNQFWQAVGPLGSVKAYIEYRGRKYTPIEYVPDVWAIARKLGLE